MPSWSIIQSASSSADVLDRHPDQLLRGDRRGRLRDRAAVAVEAQVLGDLAVLDHDVHAQLVAAERVVVVRTRGRAARARRSSAASCSARGCSRGRERPSELEHLSCLDERVDQPVDVVARRCRRGTRRGRWRRTPRQRISGCAQWWPARTQTASRSSSSAMSCGCMPSIVNDTTPPRRSRSGGPNRCDALDLGQALQRVRGQLALVRADALHADRRRGSRSAAPSPTASAIADVPASNFHGSSFQVECVDAPRARSCGRRRGTAASPRAARAGRAARRCRSGRAPCGRSRRRSRRRSRARSTGSCGTACAPSISDHRAGGACAPRDLGHRVDRAEHVRDVSDGDELHAPLGEHRVELVERQLAVVGDRAGSAARAPVSSQSSCQGTMFEWCSISVMSTSSPGPTFVAAPRVGDQVDRLGGVAGEDRARRVPAHERRDARSRAPSNASVGLARQLVDAAVDRRVGRRGRSGPSPRSPARGFCAVAAESR